MHPLVGDYPSGANADKIAYHMMMANYALAKIASPQGEAEANVAPLTLKSC